LLWQERQIVSVANLTRQDGVTFLAFAAEAGIETRTKTYRSISEQRLGRFAGRQLEARRCCFRLLAEAS